jgi:hypothetical protein
VVAAGCYLLLNWLAPISASEQPASASLGTAVPEARAGG